MRKQTKLVAVLSAAALMAMGASMTAFADWSQEDGEWVYLDRNGDRVTDEWRRSNSQWYYLDEDGYMLSGWQYLTIDPEIDAFSSINEDDDNYNDEEWFYFKSDGKAAEDEDRTINGRVYIFDEFGRMLDLWVYASTATNSAYFAEDEGSRGRNWIYAYPQTDYDDYDDDPYWFYLDKR